MYQNVFIDKENYKESVTGWTLSRRMWMAWANEIRLQHDTHYIPELALELNSYCQKR